MRTLVAFAVLGMFYASPLQASSFSGPSYGSPLTRWSGPFAANSPAGVNGQVTPVSDTQEVSEARRNFFNAYQRQLSAVGGVGRYGTAATVLDTAGPVASIAVPSFRSAAGAYSGTSSSTGSSASPVVPSRIVVSSGHVQDTAEVAAAKSEFFSLYNRQAAEAAAAPDDPIRYY
ncbi:cuticle protein CP1499-like [Palaemon carinicauda]|uniref:cuticle protein CP1499-like n=1 Tax=Palaemon carinicauda TaxID=392227 RepID=UPI0035B63FF1